MIDSRYILRFDDICPTMNWAIWERIEAQLRLHDFKPILAVVPDNRDLKLMKDPPRSDFWDRVRKWQAMGWTIALHGYQHVYVNKNAGMIRLTKQSEFAGLGYEEQSTKLKNAMAIFKEQGVRAEAWVAPSHSFDRTTIEILTNLGVPAVCDGLWPRPFRDQNGMLWIPQQLWKFRPKPAGVWTVCNHHNDWTNRELDEFCRDLAAYAPKKTDLAAVLKLYANRGLTLSDRRTALCDLMWNHRILPWLSDTRRRFFAKRPKSA